MLNQRCENVIYVNYQFQRLVNIVIQILWRHSDSFIWLQNWCSSIYNCKHPCLKTTAMLSNTWRKTLYLWQKSKMYTLVEKTKTTMTERQENKDLATDCLTKPESIFVSIRYLTRACIFTRIILLVAVFQTLCLL